MNYHFLWNEANGRDFTFLKDFHICVLEIECARPITQARVRNMIREQLALVKQNGGLFYPPNGLNCQFC